MVALFPQRRRERGEEVRDSRSQLERASPSRLDDKVRVLALLIRNKPGFWQWCKMTAVSRKYLPQSR